MCPGFVDNEFAAIVDPGIVQAILYFDASDDGPTGTNWTDLSEGFDGDTGSLTFVSDPDVNVAFGGGTTAGPAGGTITLVEFRPFTQKSVYDTINFEIFTDGKAESLGVMVVGSNELGFKQWQRLKEPAGGWSWPILQALELEVTPVWTSGDGFAGFHIVQLRVTTGGFLPRALVYDSIRPIRSLLAR